MTCVHLIGITIRHVGVSDIPAAAAAAAAYRSDGPYIYIQYNMFINTCTHTYTDLCIYIIYRYIRDSRKGCDAI